jgi:lipid-A-disaccharide synthase-like uncharacterized protein
MRMASPANWWATTPTTELIWIMIGFIAQFLFSMRFIVQWRATEKARAILVFQRGRRRDAARLRHL